MKGKVLSVDAGVSKATLTLKRSMIKDKRAPITSYEQVKNLLNVPWHARRSQWRYYHGDL